RRRGCFAHPGAGGGFERVEPADPAGRDVEQGAVLDGCALELLAQRIVRERARRQYDQWNTGVQYRRTEIAHRLVRRGFHDHIRALTQELVDAENEGHAELCGEGLAARGGVAAEDRNDLRGTEIAGANVLQKKPGDGTAAD